MIMLADPLKKYMFTTTQLFAKQILYAQMETSVVQKVHSRGLSFLVDLLFMN